MNRELANNSLAKIRQRISEGDCPTTPALSAEELEELVVHFADLSQDRSTELRLEAALEMVGSARLNIQSALAVQHLLRHGEHALAPNAHPNIHNFLAGAIKDIERADEKAEFVRF